MQDLSDGVRPFVRQHFQHGRWVEESTQVVDEVAVTLMVNGAEYVTVALTPIDVKAWTTGFLAGEGVLRRREDMTVFQWHSEEGRIWVRVPGYRQDAGARERYLGSCCGQSRPAFLGPDEPRPVAGNLNMTVDRLHRAFERMTVWSRTQRSGGLHVAALVDGFGQILAASADVGRHNALDKVFGQALARPTFSFRDSAVIFSGRLSAEIIAKVARMGCPIVASNAAATSLGVALAERWGITTVAFLRRDELSILTHAERIER